ncbi:hypothetical protein IQ07DRAFT_376298 [Pyrenochaeta sp. DS3sAY3a]|nr:hypothetical protein IQ07DRAFT_376298 [Pyrenochaeta sp. DS3sAY3a]
MDQHKGQHCRTVNDPGWKINSATVCLRGGGNDDGDGQKAIGESTQGDTGFSFTSFPPLDGQVQGFGEGKDECHEHEDNLPKPSEAATVTERDVRPDTATHDIETQNKSPVKNFDTPSPASFHSRPLQSSESLTEEDNLKQRSQYRGASWTDLKQSVPGTHHTPHEPEQRGKGVRITEGEGHDNVPLFQNSEYTRGKEARDRSKLSGTSLAREKAKFYLGDDFKNVGRGECDDTGAQAETPTSKTQYGEVESPSRTTPRKKAQFNIEDDSSIPGGDLSSKAYDDMSTQVSPSRHPLSTTRGSSNADQPSYLPSFGGGRVQGMEEFKKELAAPERLTGWLNEFDGVPQSTTPPQQPQDRLPSLSPSSSLGEPLTTKDQALVKEKIFGQPEHHLDQHDPIKRSSHTSLEPWFVQPSTLTPIMESPGPSDWIQRIAEQGDHKTTPWPPTNTGLALSNSLDGARPSLLKRSLPSSPFMPRIKSIPRPHIVTLGTIDQEERDPMTTSSSAPKQEVSQIAEMSKMRPKHQEQDSPPERSECFQSNTKTQDNFPDHGQRHPPLWIKDDISNAARDVSNEKNEHSEKQPISDGSADAAATTNIPEQQPETSARDSSNRHHRFDSADVAKSSTKTEREGSTGQTLPPPEQNPRSQSLSLSEALRVEITEVDSEPEELQGPLQSRTQDSLDLQGEEAGGHKRWGHRCCTIL